MVSDIDTDSILQCPLEERYFPVLQLGHLLLTVAYFMISDDGRTAFSTAH